MGTVLSTMDFGYSGLDEAFPACDPGVRPPGALVLCQLRSPKRKTAGGIFLTDEIIETILWNTQVAKIVAVGALAFKDRKTMEEWPEGAWCGVGDYVRVPKYGGDRWIVDLPSDDAQAFFLIVKDTDLLGVITGDPLAMKAFL